MLSIQANVLQTINLNQHLLWQYSFSNDLGFVRLSANGQTVAITTGTEPSTLTVIDGNAGRALWDYTPTGLAQENRTITALGISADGEYLAIGTSGGGIFMFHRSSNAIVQTWYTFTPITAISISEIGTFITIAFSGQLYFLRRLDGGVIWSLTSALNPDVITNFTSDHSGNHIAVSTSTPSLTFIFSSNQYYWDRNLTESTTALQLNSNGMYLFMVDQSSSRLVDQNGGTTQVYQIVPELFALSSTASRIAMASNETIFLYSSSTPNPLRNYTFTEEIPTSIGLTYHADILLLGTQSGNLYTASTADFESLWTLPLGEPITHLLTPNIGDSFLVATTTTLLNLRISSITGFYANLLPLLVILSVSVAVVVITFLFLRPKRREYPIAHHQPTETENQEG